MEFGWTSQSLHFWQYGYLDWKMAVYGSKISHVHRACVKNKFVKNWSVWKNLLPQKNAPPQKNVLRKYSNAKKYKQNDPPQTCQLFSIWLSSVNCSTNGCLITLILPKDNQKYIEGHPIKFECDRFIRYILPTSFLGGHLEKLPFVARCHKNCPGT